MDLLISVAGGIAFFAYHAAWALGLMVGQIGLTLAVLLVPLLGIGLMAEALLYVFDPKSRELSRQIRAAKAKRGLQETTGRPRKGR